MSRARILGWVVAWLAVVLVGSTLVWAVISRAGQDLVSAQQPVVATTGPAPSRHTPSSSPSSRPSHSSSSPSAPATSTPPAATYERRTWQGVGGLVVAQCDGTAISRVSLLPDDGYAVDLKDGGPEVLVVEFDGREDETGNGSTVTARCVDGVPVFDAQVQGGDD